MQTTVDIPDELYKKADLTASRQGIPLRDLIERGLRLALCESRVTGQERIAFPLLHSAQPGVLSSETARDAEERMAEQEDAARAGAL
jgi:hypothetical protein